MGAFDTVLVANRGEIALRVIRTLRRLGIRSVAVYSDADARAPHTRAADVAVRIGTAPARDSYLCADRIVAAAVRTGAQAIHPGYGFLAENADFARACAAAAVVFIGPPVDAIEAMGDKIRAKLTVAAAGVPVVPGRTQAGMTDDDLVAAATELGYPLLLKPSKGGGGKGMRVVTESTNLREQIISARREALGSFGDDTLLLERYLERPRHIEVQVIADQFGHVLHLGERECSLQRRHQKVIEEAPSALLVDGDAAALDIRERLGAAGVAAAQACGYTGAGTVEFITSAAAPNEFYFLEMNTRLQVEHPVTEAVTGLDLVELQISVAAGEPLPLTQDDVTLRGHAVEARVYAENPYAGFLPTSGRLDTVSWPSGEGVRVDAGVATGDRVGTDYDPMLAKVIAWAPTRGQALQRLRRALGDTVLLGVQTNIGLLAALAVHPEVVAGRLDTGLLDRETAELVAADTPPEVAAAAALVRLAALDLRARDGGPWDATGAWRIGGPDWMRWRATVLDAGPVEVLTRGLPTDAEVAVADEPVVRAALLAGDGWVDVTYDGVRHRFAFLDNGFGAVWLARDGRTWVFRAAEAYPSAAEDEVGAGDGRLHSPMPGTVTEVSVQVGMQVSAGQPLVVVEAMKMEHAVRAPFDGTVADVLVRAGQPVALDAPLVVVTRAEAEGES